MSGMLPPVLFELRSNATQFMGDMQAARASLAETGAAGDKTAADVQAATIKQEQAAARLADANSVSADSIRASVDRVIEAEQKLAAETDTTYDAEARRAQLTATAVRSAAAEQIAAVDEVAAADKRLVAASEAAATKQEESTAASSGAFKKMGGIVAGATVAAAVVVGVESLKMATDFQKQITLLQTAGGETKANIGIVANGIKTLAQSTGTSTTELADGMYIVEKAGIRGANGLLVLKAAAEGAKAENVDLGTATNALTSIMMSYHLQASQATSAENMLVKGAGMAKTTMQNYAGALSTVIPIASAAKISFAQVAGAIATLTQHGTSAQEATQELSSTIRNLQAPNNVAVQAMQQLGINVTDLETHLGTRGLTGTISLITDAIQKKMGPAGLVVVNSFKQSQSATADLQVELSKMPASLASISKEFESGKMPYADYYKAVKALGGSQYELGKGFISTMAQAKGFNALLTAGTPAQQTAANALKKVMGGAIGLNTALMLGGPNMKYFTTATKAVGDAGKQSGKDISTWAMTQKTLGVQMDKLKETVQVLFINIGTKLIPVVTKVVEWMTKHKTVVEILLGSLAALAVILTTVAAATWAVNVAMDANPVVLITLAIAALAAGLYEAYEHCKTFRDIVNDIGRVLLDVWNKALKPFVNFVKADFIVQLHAAEAVIDWFKTLPGDIVTAWNAVLNWFQNLPSLILGYLKDAGSWLLGVGKKIVSGLLTGLYDEYVGIYKWVVSEGGLVGLGKKMMVALYDGVKAAAGVFWKFWSAIPGTTLKLLKDAGIWLLHIGEDLITGLWKGVIAAAKSFWTFWTELPGEVVKLVGNVQEWTWHVGRDLIVGIWNGLIASVKTLWDWVKAFPGEVFKLLNTVYDDMLTVGKNIVIGLWNGIAGSAGWLWKQVKGWLSDLWGGIEDFLGIHSPSTKARDRLGKNLVLGVAAGITENGHYAKTALTNLASDLAKTNMTAPGMKGVPFTNTPGSYGNTAATSGAPTMVIQVNGTVIDYAGLFDAVQKAALQHGGVNSQTWAPFIRGGGSRT